MTIETPRWDVYSHFIARSKNAEYTGTSAGQAFLNGKANIEGLEPDASDEKVAERIKQLDWFVSSGYTLEEAEFMSAKG